MVLPYTLRYSSDLCDNPGAGILIILQSGLYVDLAGSTGDTAIDCATLLFHLVR